MIERTIIVEHLTLLAKQASEFPNQPNALTVLVDLRADELLNDLTKTSEQPDEVPDEIDAIGILRARLAAAACVIARVDVHLRQRGRDHDRELDRALMTYRKVEASLKI